LVALLPSPAAAPDAIARRACRLLPESDCEAARQLVFQGVLDRRAIAGGEGIAPHFAADWVQRFKPQAGAVVRTTLSASLQRRVLEALRSQVDEIRSENANDAVAVVLDNASGELLAYVGGLGRESSAPRVDGARSRRQAGSTLKPFLYALAFDRRIITPWSRVPDNPEGVSLSEGKVYQPENYDRQFRGDDVRASVALASSLNLPAVRLLTWVSVPDFHALLGNLGFSSLRAPEDYGPSLALGSADVTLMELAQAYRVLANGGIRADGQKVLSPGAAFLTQWILSDRSARYTAFGLENPLNLPFWAWAKTGTSKDMRDNWCVGATDRYTVAVWVGNLSGAPMRGVTGISGAGPAWREIVLSLHKEAPSVAPRPPQGEVVPLGNGFVLAGTEAAAQAALGPPRGEVRAEIASPEDGAWFALDPDIGSRSQKLLLKSRGWRQGWAWRVNGKELAARFNAAPWGIDRRGRFRIELVDRKSGRVLDQVRIAVR
jgi:penicillin-binding protein 1C